MCCTAFMTADKSVNQLESRKLRTTLGCDAGPYVLREYCTVPIPAHHGGADGSAAAPALMLRNALAQYVPTII